MDGYPNHYVEHNLPFVALFGLGPANRPRFEQAEKDFPLLTERGIYISSELPNITSPASEDLLGGFREFDARHASWNGRPGKGKMGTMSFTYRAVGRVGQTHPLAMGMRRSMLC